MPKQNTNAQKTQIIEVLKQDYFPMIPQLRQKWTADQHEKNRLSRSLAAFAIANLADVTPAQAANSIINGENDNGIDAVYFDRIKNFLWLVQAKVGNAPNMGDNKKFCDGIRDLVHRRFQKFEAHYLKVMCDEIFGRGNFVANVVWQKKFSPQANAVWLSDSHDHVLVYAKNKNIWRPNFLPRSAIADSRYSNPDNDPRGLWTSGDFTISLTGGQRGAQFAKTGISENIYEIETPSGRRLLPTKGRCWAASENRFIELLKDNRIWFGKSGDNVPRIKRFLSEVQEGIVCMTLWLRTEVGDNQEAKREVMTFNAEELFATPKPERLLQRVIELASEPSDIILDSFAGSGTTGAVAHKMGRRWIMIELGEHCHTHIIPRLKKVIDAVNWKSGGGFRYYHLAPSLLEKDKWDNWIINKTYNSAMLAEALCKIEGFKYSPSDTFYWQHGYSTERDFIYVTTQNLSHEQLSKLSDEVGQEHSLLVLCSAFRGKADRFTNLTIKKIPKQILARCEWGHDDYSLKIENLPKAPPKTGQLSLFDVENI